MQLKSVRTPGKVMLSGEYAVLYGGTAVLMPVPRYLEIKESEIPQSSGYSKVVQTALEYPIPEIAEYEKKHDLPGLSINNQEFYCKCDDGNSVKLGLGGSAAEAVGVVSLRFQKADFLSHDDPDLIFKYAVEIHKKAQSGLGSGADVAVCAYNKPIKFRVSGNDYKIETIETKNVLNSIPLHLVWTGRPANTRTMIQQFQDSFDQEETENVKYLNILVDAGNELADAWFKASRKELFALIDRFDQAMDECALMAEIQYKLPIHHQIAKWAKSHNGRAKPTGAGGGDMILLIGNLPFKGIKHPVIPL